MHLLNRSHGRFWDIFLRILILLNIISILLFIWILFKIIRIYYERCKKRIIVYLKINDNFLYKRIK